jgi:hypothetical protein
LQQSALRRYGSTGATSNPWEGCMSAYDQHHPRGPVDAQRPIVAGLASDTN